MPKTLTEVMDRLPPVRRARIEADTAAEAAGIMTLREVRKAFRMSQESVAKALDMEQESVSRLERRSDLLLSTLRKYVAAMGGSLKLVAEFPHHPPIQIETLSELDDEPEAETHAKKRRS
jgi:transcriptional regulator with XRE-family HTH domain